MEWLNQPLNKADFDSEAMVEEQSLPIIEEQTAQPQESVPESSEATKTNIRKKSTRYVKDLLEEQIYKARVKLFTQLESVFFYPTSWYFEGEGGDELGHRGHSKDYRQDLNQSGLGLVIDNLGFPVGTEIWPGNTAEVTILDSIAERLIAKFDRSAKTS
ncbi:MAG: hypothetical protein LBV23_04160 [Deltaproteobacteria bacterium]|jgi:transposase|nr:hypothetical protein [Deltaproteobacteria bacterium]